MRILHLIDPAHPGAGPCTLKAAAEAVSRTPTFDHDVLVIGNAGHLAMARRCGLNPRGRIGAPLNHPVLARDALRSFLQSYERARGRYDLVHAWTPVAAAAVPAGRRVLVASIGAGWRLWSAARARQVAEIPAGVDGAAVDTEQRALLREQWGADETCFVVGVLGEPAGAVGGEVVLNAAGRAALTGRDVRVVLHHEATVLGGLRRWMPRMGLGRLVVVDDRVIEPWRIAAGFDAAVLAHGPRAAPRSRRRWHRLVPPVLQAVTTGDRPGPPGSLPGLWAMAAGVPVIVERSHPVGGLIEDSNSGLLVAPGSFNNIAARIVDLFDDPHKAGSIGAAGRALVETRHRADVFAKRLATVWEQIRRGDPIEPGSDRPVVATVKPGHPAPLQPAR